MLPLLQVEKFSVYPENINEHEVKKDRKEERIKMKSEACRVRQYRFPNSLLVKPRYKVEGKYGDHHGEDQKDYVHSFFFPKGKHDQHHGG